MNVCMCVCFYYLRPLLKYTKSTGCGMWATYVCEQKVDDEMNCGNTLLI